MKTIVIKILLVFALCNTAFSQGLPVEVDSTYGMLSFQYADSSYNFYNPCNVTRIQTFERYPNVVWVYIIEDETVRIEKIDVSVLDAPSGLTTLEMIEFIVETLDKCFTASIIVIPNEDFHYGWITSSGVWRTNDESWLVN